MEGAVNEDPHTNYGRSSGVAKLSCTPAQQTGMLVVFSSVCGGGVILGGTAEGISKPHEWKVPHMVHQNMNSCTIPTYMTALYGLCISYTLTHKEQSHQWMLGDLAPPTVPPLVRLTFSWSTPASATGVEWMCAGNTRCHHKSSPGLATLYVHRSVDK